MLYGASLAGNRILLAETENSANGISLSLIHILRMDKKPDRSEIITMSLLYALTLVLTVLKVTRTFSLPWLWVLGPLWLGTRRYCD